MKRIIVATSDNKIWDQSWVYADIAREIENQRPFEIDLIREGPDIESLGLYDFIEKVSAECNFPLSNITAYTSNALERHPSIKIVYQPPMYLVHSSKEYHESVHKQNELKHFGLFVGRSNAPRLLLASHLHKNHNDKSFISYHFNLEDEFHLQNIGIENLIKYHNIKNVCDVSEFLSKCPIKLKETDSLLIDKNSSRSPAQQLLEKDRNFFSKIYQEFFVEIVCESYFTGKSFFPTEKIFRPILLKTPFIVQGPQYFLHNLRELGFKTFGEFWNEGYAEDPYQWQLNEITTLVDKLSTLDGSQLKNMYQSMQDILEHNYNRFFELTEKDFNTIRLKNQQ